jgi:hypothetical protein
MLQKFNMTLFAAVLALFAVSISASPDARIHADDDSSEGKSTRNQTHPTRHKYCPDVAGDNCILHFRNGELATFPLNPGIEIEMLHERCREAGFDAAVTLVRVLARDGDVAVACEG